MNSFAVFIICASVLTIVVIACVMIEQYWSHCERMKMLDKTPPKPKAQKVVVTGVKVEGYNELKFPPATMRDL